TRPRGRPRAARVLPRAVDDWPGRGRVPVPDPAAGQGRCECPPDQGGSAVPGEFAHLLAGALDGEVPAAEGEPGPAAGSPGGSGARSLGSGDRKQETGDSRTAAVSVPAARQLSTQYSVLSTSDDAVSAAGAGRADGRPVGAAGRPGIARTDRTPCASEPGTRDARTRSASGRGQHARRHPTTSRPRDLTTPRPHPLTTAFSPPAAGVSNPGSRCVPRPRNEGRDARDRPARAARTHPLRATAKPHP